ncbi:tail fiber protein [Nostoc sp. CHAB 5715]
MVKLASRTNSKSETLACLPKAVPQIPLKKSTNV